MNIRCQLSVGPAFELEVILHIEMAHYFLLRVVQVSGLCAFGADHKIILVGLFHFIHLLVIGEGFVAVANLIAYTNMASIATCHDLSLRLKKSCPVARTHDTLIYFDVLLKSSRLDFSNGDTRNTCITYTSVLSTARR